MSRKVLIVGGVAGGASAAARLRRLDEDAEIIIFEKGRHISYANCGLPYYIGGVIEEEDFLVVQTPEAMKSRFNIDVRVNSEVISIDPHKKSIEVHDKIKDILYKETYDYLILSPGAEPIRPDVPGMFGDKVFTLRTIFDTNKIKEYVDSVKPKRAVIVGAGFIGLEIAENLHKRGVKVTIVELADHVMGPLDFDMAAILHQHLKENGVELYLNNSVRYCRDEGSYNIIELTSGETIKTDMIVLGIGVRPDTKLASDAGLKIGATGGILVNEYMQTSDPYIYAVGDAVEIRDFLSGQPVRIPLAGPANKQGRIAADNICGRKEKYTGTQGTSILKVFDITAACTGNNERILKRNKVDYEKSFIHTASHATYYPGAVSMSIKLIFEKKDGKILGAQIVGYKGVDKRIDVIATAIRAGMTVFDLGELELAYAPPFSSAKDPVNISGYVASNILKKDVAVFHWDEVESIDPDNSILLDVRTEEEHRQGTIKNSINIPLDELRERLDALPKDKEIFVFCQAGLRGYIASRILLQKGFKKVKNLSGGYETYQVAMQKQSNEKLYDYDILVRESLFQEGKL
ncbi:MAG TPA: CoA-disulfide reductase [Clostridiaceae bacterium]|nr:CoA-disulfide reductase [Clostridiaceae bacterium]